VAGGVLRKKGRSQGGGNWEGGGGRWAGLSAESKRPGGGNRRHESRIDCKGDECPEGGEVGSKWGRTYSFGMQKKLT